MCQKREGADQLAALHIRSSLPILKTFPTISLWTYATKMAAIYPRRPTDSLQAYRDVFLLTLHFEKLFLVISHLPSQHAFLTYAMVCLFRIWGTGLGVFVVFFKKKLILYKLSGNSLHYFFLLNMQPYFFLFVLTCSGMPSQ